MTDIPCVICNKDYDHRTGDHICVGNLQDEIERLRAENELWRSSRLDIKYYLEKIKSYAKHRSNYDIEIAEMADDALQALSVSAQEQGSE